MAGRIPGRLEIEICLNPLKDSTEQHRVPSIRKLDLISPTCAACSLLAVELLKQDAASDSSCNARPMLCHGDEDRGGRSLVARLFPD